jgi:hypothetical protein
MYRNPVNKSVLTAAILALAANPNLDNVRIISPVRQRPEELIPVPNSDPNISARNMRRLIKKQRGRS